MPIATPTQPLTNYAYDVFFYLRIVVTTCLRQISQTLYAPPVVTQTYSYDDINHARTVATLKTAYDAPIFELSNTPEHAYNDARNASAVSPDTNRSPHYDDLAHHHRTTPPAATSTDYDTTPDNSQNFTYDAPSPPGTFVYGTYIDEPIAKIESGNTLYYHCNRKYDVAGLTDSTGNIVELYAYTPYGSQAMYDATGTEILISAVSNPYGFTGRRLDEETGLWYFRGRYFDSELGRFIGRDPIGYVDGPNRYQYVGSRAINYIDPLGLLTRDCIQVKRLKTDTGWTYVMATPAGLIGGGSDGGKAASEYVAIYIRTIVHSYDCRCDCTPPAIIKTRTQEFSTQLNLTHAGGDVFFSGIPGTWPPIGGTTMASWVWTYIQSSVGTPVWLTDPVQAGIIAGEAAAAAPANTVVGTLERDDPVPQVTCK